MRSLHPKHALAGIVVGTLALPSVALADDGRRYVAIVTSPGEEPPDRHPPEAADQPVPEDTGPIERRSPERKRKSYFLPLALAYAAAPVAGWLLVDADVPAMAAPLVLAAPTVHWLHREKERGWISLAMQPTAAYTGAAIALAPVAVSCRDDECETSRAVLGGAIAGYAAWAIADLAFFSSTGTRPPVAATITSTREGPRLGVRGTF